MSNARFGLRVRNGLVRGITEGLPSLDADALAFINATGIVNLTQQIAINTLVIQLKTLGLWTKLRAIYPFVGGTASTHKFNLKDPRDLDAAFRLIFNGGWTHSANGALPNGTNANADTRLNLNTMNSINDISYGYYSRTDNTSIGSFGWGVGGNIFNEFYIRYTDGNKYGYLFDSANNGGAAPTCLGFNAMSRIASNLKYIQFNNTINTFSSVSSGSLISRNFHFAQGSQGYENRQNAFGFVGDGLTNTQLANLYTTVQTFQTTLGRQV